MLGDTRAGGLNTPRLTRLLMHVEEKEKEIVRQLIKNHLETSLGIFFAQVKIEITSGQERTKSTFREYVTCFQKQKTRLSRGLR